MKLSQPSHEFRVESSWLTMRDGVRLSATIFRPVRKVKGERFPVILELLPYRKDDSFYLRDYPIYSYFARRGYIMVKVDVRGTGSSEGPLPPREYSDLEISDAVEVIAQLSKQTDCNGKAGMWGISWGGFNAIQTAMHRPKQLKAILALHASDDLFHDDVRYIDGVFHMDPYALEIDHENGLPRTPDFKLDTSYFRNRFDVYPWILTYLKQQRDGDFWRAKSLRWNYDAINIPVYLISGLLDGYRDSVLRMLENMKVPMIAELGPWNHTFPDTGTPGPNHEWRERALMFWDRWLKGKRNELMNHPRLAVYVRDGHAPDPEQKHTPGHWRYEDWPINRTRLTNFRATANGALVRACKGRCRKSGTAESALDLKYVASAGVEAGYWWGETTGDMRRDDALSLTFDSALLAKEVEIVGFPKVHLKVSTETEQATFVARLEDVGPDGAVSLVAGAALNGSQRHCRANPSAMEPGKTDHLEFELHFTTWTFKPGHRIRLAVSNAQFPMLWPSPKRMTTVFFVGSEDGTSITLPVVPRQVRSQPILTPPQPQEVRKDAEYIYSKSHDTRFGGVQNWKPRTQMRNALTDETVVSSGKSGAFRIRNRLFKHKQLTTYTTSDKNPARSTFTGSSSTAIISKVRKLELLTEVKVISDLSSFHVTFTRILRRNGRIVRKRSWKESISRDFQ